MFWPDVLAFLITEKSFRKIQGYRDLWMLKAVLEPAGKQNQPPLMQEVEQNDLRRRSPPTEFRSPSRRGRLPLCTHQIYGIEAKQEEAGQT